MSAWCAVPFYPLRKVLGDGVPSISAFLQQCYLQNMEDTIKHILSTQKSPRCTWLGPNLAPEPISSLDPSPKFDSDPFKKGQSRADPEPILGSDPSL